MDSLSLKKSFLFPSHTSGESNEGVHRYKSPYYHTISKLFKSKQKEKSKQLGNPKSESQQLNFVNRF